LKRLRRGNSPLGVTDASAIRSQLVAYLNANRLRIQARNDDAKLAIGRSLKAPWVHVLLDMDTFLASESHRCQQNRRNAAVMRKHACS